MKLDTNIHHSVFTLSTRPHVSDVMLKLCEHDVSQTACMSFAEFTTCVQFWLKMSWLDLEVKMSKGQDHSNDDDDDDDGDVWSGDEADQCIVGVLCCLIFSDSSVHSEATASATASTSAASTTAATTSASRD